MVPFLGSCLESYKVIPKRNYYGAFGYALRVSQAPATQRGWPLNSAKAFALQV